MGKLLCAIGLHPWEEMRHTGNPPERRLIGDWGKHPGYWLIGYECPRCKKRIGPRQFNWKREVDAVVRQWRNGPLGPLDVLLGLGGVAIGLGLPVWFFGYLAWVIFRDLVLR